MNSQTELATFGAGCFWGVEAAFRKVKGITTITSGYMGGHKEQPSYEDVVFRRTGHVEVVRVEFDPAKVSYQQLLELFWFVHDPTQVNRQGNDVGDEYRSVIFYHTPEQKAAAEAARAKLTASGAYAQPIATSIEPIQTFWPAEDYHQDFLTKNPNGYCHVPLGNVKQFLMERNLLIHE